MVRTRGRQKNFEKSIQIPNFWHLDPSADPWFGVTSSRWVARIEKYLDMPTMERREFET